MDIDICMYMYIQLYTEVDTKYDFFLIFFRCFDIYFFSFSQLGIQRPRCKRKAFSASRLLACLQQTSREEVERKTRGNDLHGGEGKT